MDMDGISTTTKEITMPVQLTQFMFNKAVVVSSVPSSVFAFVAPLLESSSASSSQMVVTPEVMMKKR